MTRLCLSSLVLLIHCASLHADVTLIQDGKPRCVLIVMAPVMDPDNPKTATLKTREREAELARQRLRESIKDLAACFEKMSGAKIEIIVWGPATEIKEGILPIYIGDAGEKMFGNVRKTYPYKQGYGVVVTPKKVGLWGESDLASSYAIYEVLDRLGCRWFMPSDMGEVIPKRPTITLKEGDEALTPGTIYRGLWFADDAYRRRNRLGGLLLSAGHALEFYLTPEDRKKHPDWQAIVGGKPHPSRLKWSKPEVAAAIADKLILSLDNDRTPSMSLSPDDGIDFDESAEDKALDAGDWDGPAQTVSLTDRLMVLCNRVAAKTVEKHPDVLFGMLAYAQYTRAPVREKVHPSIVPQIAPITYTRAHPMTDDAVPGNKDLRALITGWGKKAKMTSIYFYGWFLAEPSAPNPMIGKWSVDVPFVLANNCQFFQPETLTNFETSMHGLYLGIRLAFNPSLKPADIVADLNEKFYGHAAKEMTAYWSFIDDVWTKTPEYSGCGFGYLRRWTPERMKESRLLLDAGLAACRTTMEMERVRLADRSLELFELFMQTRRDLAEGRWADLKSDGETWQKMVRYLGRKYKDEYTFTLTSYRPETINGNYFAQFYQQTYDDTARLMKDFVILTSPPQRVFRYQLDADKEGEKKGYQRADFDDKAWKSTDVCMETWSTLGHHDYFKSMWYRAEMKLPETPKGKKVFLWVGATDGSAKIFVNGAHVPHVDAKGMKKEAFDGYCQPFSVDISHVAKAGANQVTILCTRTFFNELGTGGLLAPVVVYREK